MKITALDFLEFKWLNSHIFMSFCGRKDMDKYGKNNQ